MSTAQPMGITLEETAAAIGILGDGTLRGSVATNTLASGLSRLAKPTRQMRVLMKGLGVQAFDSQGKFIGLARLTQELERITANMTDQQKQATLATLFGANAIKNFSTLLNAQKKIQIDAGNANQIALMKRLLGEERVNKALTKGGAITLKGAEALKAYNIVLATAEGTAKKMAETMDNNLAGDITKAKSAFSGLMITIGDKFDPILRRMTQAATEILSELGNNFDQYLGILTKAFAPLQKAFGDFRTELLFSLGLTGAFDQKSLGVKEVVEGVAQAVTFVTPFITTLLHNIAGLMNTLATTFAPMKSEVQSVLEGLRTNLLMVSQDVWGVAGSLVQALAPIIEVAISVGNTIMQNFGQIWKTVVGVVNTILPYVHQLTGSFKENVHVGGVLGRVMIGATAVINGLRPVLHAVLRILTPLGKLFLWLGGLLLDIVGVAFEKLGKIAGSVFESLGNLMNGLMDKLNWVLKGIKGGLRFLGIMSREADNAAKKAGQADNNRHQSGIKPPGSSQRSQADKLADAAKAQKEAEKLKKLQQEIDRFKMGNSKTRVPVMSNAAFDKLIAPPSRKKSTTTSQSKGVTDFTSGTTRITGGGSKQVHINITIGAINGVGNIENVNNIESNTEVNQSADFIVQEIVRKINGALMVQEGV